MIDQDFARDRGQVLEALTAFATGESEAQGLWLQGSLARGDADPLSDIDAYLAIDDASLDAVYGRRETILASLRPVIAWADATTPGLKAVHALLDGGVRLDLFFEPASKVGEQKRPALRLLLDKADLAARLQAGWEAPAALIGRIVGVIVRMTRQGGTWPLRALRRGQWSTFAMMELDLINAQIAQLMAVQIDPANFYQNPFSLYRRLRPEQQAVLDTLSQEALNGLARRDAAAMLQVHLKVLDALVREGRAACDSLGVVYPITGEGDARLRGLLQRAWPL
jgi:hypothetical protein